MEPYVFLPTFQNRIGISLKLFLKIVKYRISHLKKYDLNMEIM